MASGLAESLPDGRTTWRDSSPSAVNICSTNLQKIGIYGGTFDPVHHGHLILAREALEKFSLEKVIFIPAGTSPHKQTPFVSGDVRLEMLRAAIEGEEQFEVDDTELRRPAPSYTIETVEYLRENYPAAQLFLMIGDDNLATLPTWRRFDDLQQIVTFVVLRRAEAPVDHQYLSIKRQLEISATEIRDRIAAGRSIRYFVPEAVREIIRTRRLYQEGAK